MTYNNKQLLIKKNNEQFTFNKDNNNICDNPCKRKTEKKKEKKDNIPPIKYFIKVTLKFSKVGLVSDFMQTQFNK